MRRHQRLVGQTLLDRPGFDQFRKNMRQIRRRRGEPNHLGTVLAILSDDSFRRRRRLHVDLVDEHQIDLLQRVHQPSPFLRFSVLHGFLPPLEHPRHFRLQRTDLNRRAGVLVAVEVCRPHTDLQPVTLQAGDQLVGQQTPIRIQRGAATILHAPPQQRRHRERLSGASRATHHKRLAVRPGQSLDRRQHRPSLPRARSETAEQLVDAATIRRADNHLITSFDSFTRVHDFHHPPRS